MHFSSSLERRASRKHRGKSFLRRRGRNSDQGGGLLTTARNGRRFAPREPNARPIEPPRYPAKNRPLSQRTCRSTRRSKERMASIRNILARKRRRIYFVTLFSFLIFVFGMTAVAISKAFLLLGLIGFISAMVCVIFMLFLIRCPSCGENLGYAIIWPATWSLSVSERIKYCQFCCISLDKELEK
jgi:hypothetical protein